jgi:hypothetical protein
MIGMPLSNRFSGRACVLSLMRSVSSLLNICIQCRVCVASGGLFLDMWARAVGGMGEQARTTPAHVSGGPWRSLGDRACASVDDVARHKRNVGEARVRAGVAKTQSKQRAGRLRFGMTIEIG